MALLYRAAITTNVQVQLLCHAPAAYDIDAWLRSGKTTKPCLDYVSRVPATLKRSNYEPVCAVAVPGTTARCLETIS